MSISVKDATSITLGGVEVTKIADTSGNTLWEATSPLCFTSSGTSTIKLSIYGTLSNAIDSYYSYDKSTWNSWLSGTSGESSTITLTDGQKLYVWNKNSTLSESVITSNARFVMTGSLAASGNVNSMINYAELSNYCFSYLFGHCASLTTPPSLPATTLSKGCYDNMFYNCTGLTSLPANLLPATTLVEYCYEAMFQKCTSLTTTPELPATTLKSICYKQMFSGCSSLKVNENGTEGTTIFTCPTSVPSSAVTGMFENTGGTFTGTPTAGNTYKYY